jgi:neurotransmitter:Na+ symporter, NSS family
MRTRHWPNQWIFILAAVGSAAGLGNIWRFPYLTYEYGGGAFVVAIIIANIIIGIPLLLLEVGVGQMFQKGAPDAFAHLKKSFKYLGWIAILMGFLVLAYYMSVVSWGINFLASSFTLAWGADTKSFFFNNILELSSGVDAIGGIAWSAFVGLIVAWILVYFSAWKGVESISKVVLWTATLPFIILLILIVRAVSLDGAGEGLRLFFVPDWQALLNPRLWLEAFSQVFFSLSLAFGIMIAYGALKERASDIVRSVVWVAVGNFIVSLMSGVVVFGMLGYLANQQNVDITTVVIGGPSLVFVIFPAIINLLPALNAFIATLFFLGLLTLAIDSAFSLLEAVAKTFNDRFPRVRQTRIVLGISIIGFISSLIFVTKGGLYVLDIVDHFVVNYGLITIGALEAILVGWLWNHEDLKTFINNRSTWKIGAGWTFSIRFIIPIFLSGLLIWNVINEFKSPYEGYPAWALLYIGALPIVLTPLIALFLERVTSKRL